MDRSEPPPEASARSAATAARLTPGAKLSNVSSGDGASSRMSCSIDDRVDTRCLARSLRVSARIHREARTLAGCRQTLTRPSEFLSYRDAGVDIDAGDALVEAIKPYARRTLRPEVLAGIGGFGALVELPKRYREPVLVSGTDGVGTKLKLALAMNRHETIGIDLVAMSVNDILVQGAEPLFFLDYYVCERLDVKVATEVIRGIAAGCEQAGCALIGGETAEHPDAFLPGEYDLAGFAVGVVEKSKAIDGTRVRAGDALLGLASSGPHSNGFSLIRRILALAHADLGQSY